MNRRDAIRTGAAALVLSNLEVGAYAVPVGKLRRVGLIGTANVI
ncbi:MAG: hypothetical protein ABGX16_09080 [Pirellulales bacterium]